MSTIIKNTLLKSFSSSSRSTSVSGSPQFTTQCNYANNYYGDQVCVEVKQVKPRVNLHMSVQM
jgi:hypothetical protein